MVAKNATVTKEQTKQEMLRITTELGRVPKRNEFFKMTNLKGCHKQGISILFGKNPYNSLILFSGLEVNTHSKEPKQIVNCKTCSKEIEKFASELRKHENTFCSSSCSAAYNNKHKTHGTRRSKYEIQLEEFLGKELPTLMIKFSDKTAIGSELDVYIPSLNIAFEIQGIFHYKPIFGQEKLAQIQKNDLLKVDACNKLGIKLYHIDISKLTRCTEKNCEEYNQEILSILKNALSN